MENEVNTYAASQLVKRGIHTGPISKAFSFIQIATLLYLLFYLGLKGHYILLGIIALLGFTPFGIFGSIGSIIYLLFLQDGYGLAVQVITLASGILSAHFGMMNVKKYLAKHPEVESQLMLLNIQSAFDI